MAAFEELGIMPEVIRAIEEMGWLLPTPVQTESIPLILGGGDVMAAAETGSGKTGAFALPILQIVHEALRAEDRQRASTQAAPVKQTYKLNLEDATTGIDISSDGFSAESTSAQAWQGCRANVGVQGGGKHYFEITITGTGLARVGWSTQAASLDLGTDKQGFGFGGTGKKSHDRQFDSYGVTFGANDTIGCYLDLDSLEIYFSKNGVDLGLAFSIPKHMTNAVFYPTICIKQSSVSINFGGKPFVGDLKSFGFTGILQSKINQKVFNTSGGSAPQPVTAARQPLCIIIEPTRELAEQVSEEIKKFKKYLNAPSVEHKFFVGGMSSVKDCIRDLEKGVDIIIATPGRLSELIDTGKLSLSYVKFFVLDEADRLLDTGNQDQILSFHKLATVGRDKPVQVLLFSATLHSPEISKLSSKICKFPTWVDLKGKDAVPDTVKHALIHVDPMNSEISGGNWLNQLPQVTSDGVHQREMHNIVPGRTNPETLSEAVKRIKPTLIRRLIDSYKMEQCLIFCRTKIDCDNLEAYLNTCGGGRSFKGAMEKGKENPYSCVVLHGDRSPGERRQNLQHFKDGDVRFLISTDVAARGIDISGLPYVINMTLPDKSEDYIHRIGRVGRADCMGLAISLVASCKEKVWYHSCPSRGKSCNNTNLAEKGGCCIWYDEPQFLKDIEKRLAGGDDHLPVKIDVLSPSAGFLLPGLKPGDTPGKVFGQIRSGPVNEALLQHLEWLRGPVKSLAVAEKEAQQAYLRLKHRFSSTKR